MDWLSYSQSQELRERLTNIQQTLYESVEDKDENFEQNFRELCLFLNPADSMHALDKILDKRKDAIRITNGMFPCGLFMELSGIYQFENCLTILTALEELERIGYRILPKDYLNGFSDVCQLTGLMGRWQKVYSYPDIICDTGHNVDGIKYICEQLDFTNRLSSSNSISYSAWSTTKT